MQSLARNKNPSEPTTRDAFASQAQRIARPSSDSRHSVSWLRIHHSPKQYRASRSTAIVRIAFSRCPKASLPRPESERRFLLLWREPGDDRPRCQHVFSSRPLQSPVDVCVEKTAQHNLRHTVTVTSRLRCLVNLGIVLCNRRTERDKRGLSAGKPFTIRATVTAGLC